MFSSLVVRNPCDNSHLSFTWSVVPDSISKYFHPSRFSVTSESNTELLFLLLSVLLSFSCQSCFQWFSFRLLYLDIYCCCLTNRCLSSFEKFDWQPPRFEINVSSQSSFDIFDIIISVSQLFNVFSLRKS